jgi:26S proteasome regulatory subunit (ATPase 3-interacting protein)
MATKKDATATGAVFDYLQAQNRPYSVNDIVLNLHKEHGKTAVQKALDKLVQVDLDKNKNKKKKNGFI